MSGFSSYLSQAILNKTLVDHTFPAAATLYLALFISDPTDANTGTEVSGGWYARQATGAWSAPVAAAAVDGSINWSSSNTTQIQFAAVTGGAVTVTHWAIYDAATSGNMLYSDILGTLAVPAPKTFGIGDVPIVAAGALTINTN